MPHSKPGTQDHQEGVAPSEILISLESPVAHTRDERVSAPIEAEGIIADPAPLSDGTDEGLAADEGSQARATAPIPRNYGYNNLFALSPVANQTPEASEASDHTPTDGYESDGPLMF